MSTTQHIRITDSDDGWHHVIANIHGDSEDECLVAASVIYARYCTGRIHVVRRKPEGRADKCFETTKTVFTGSVRFSYRDEPGGAFDLEEPKIAYAGMGHES